MFVVFLIFCVGFYLFILGKDMIDMFDNYMLLIGFVIMIFGLAVITASCFGFYLEFTK